MVIDLYKTFCLNYPQINSIDISDKKEVIIDCGPVLGIMPVKQIEINISYASRSTNKI
jgi:hypothetical protein